VFGENLFFFPTSFEFVGRKRLFCTTHHNRYKVMLRLNDLVVPAQQGGDLDDSESKWDFVPVRTQRSGRHPEMQGNGEGRSKKQENGEGSTLESMPRDDLAQKLQFALRIKAERSWNRSMRPSLDCKMPESHTPVAAVAMDPAEIRGSSSPPLKIQAKSPIRQRNCKMMSSGGRALVRNFLPHGVTDAPHQQAPPRETAEEEVVLLKLQQQSSLAGISDLRATLQHKQKEARRERKAMQKLVERQQARLLLSEEKCAHFKALSVRKEKTATELRKENTAIRAATAQYLIASSENRQERQPSDIGPKLKLSTPLKEKPERTQRSGGDCRDEKDCRKCSQVLNSTRRYVRETAAHEDAKRNDKDVEERQRGGRKETRRLEFGTGKQRGAECIQAEVGGITTGSQEEACGKEEIEVKKRLGTLGVLRGCAGVPGLRQKKGHGTGGRGDRDLGIPCQYSLPELSGEADSPPNVIHGGNSFVGSVSALPLSSNITITTITGGLSRSEWGRGNALEDALGSVSALSLSRSHSLSESEKVSEDRGQTPSMPSNISLTHVHAEGIHSNNDIDCSSTQRPRVRWAGQGHAHTEGIHSNSDVDYSSTKQAQRPRAPSVRDTGQGHVMHMLARAEGIHSNNDIDYSRTQQAQSPPGVRGAGQGHDCINYSRGKITDTDLTKKLEVAEELRVCVCEYTSGKGVSRSWGGAGGVEVQKDVPVGIGGGVSRWRLQGGGQDIGSLEGAVGGGDDLRGWGGGAHGGESERGKGAQDGEHTRTHTHTHTHIHTRKSVIPGACSRVRVFVCLLKFVSVLPHTHNTQHTTHNTQHTHTHTHTHTHFQEFY
jgi:hypothetical protein